MEDSFDLIPGLMDSLADARAALKVCLSAFPKGVEAARQQKADRLRRQISETIKEIEAARLKVLERLMAEPEAEDTAPQ